MFMALALFSTHHWGLFEGIIEWSVFYFLSFFFSDLGDEEDEEGLDMEDDELGEDEEEVSFFSSEKCLKYLDLWSHAFVVTLSKQLFLLHA